MLVLRLTRTPPRKGVGSLTRAAVMVTWRTSELGDPCVPGPGLLIITTREVLLSSPFYRWGTQGLGRRWLLSIAPGRAGILVRAFFLQSLPSPCSLRKYQLLIRAGGVVKFQKQRRLGGWLVLTRNSNRRALGQASRVSKHGFLG